MSIPSGMRAPASVGRLLSDGFGMLKSVPAPPLTPQIVGRDAELTILRRRWRRAVDGDGGTLVLAGDAGFGKTRLVEQLQEWARDDGAQVLAGGCVDLGDDPVPFAPFVTALRGLLRARGVDELASLAGPRRDDLSELLPDLSRPGAAAGPSPDRRRLYEAVLDLVEGVAISAPLLLVLEDLHWADRSTRELLGFVARGLGDAPVLVVATYRSDDLHRAHPLRPFLTQLERTREVERLELRPLTRDAVGAQLAQLLQREPTERELDDAFSRSEGNPLFVEELSCCPLTNTVPSSLRDLLLVRAERISDDAQHVLRVASVMGTDVDAALLAAVMGRGEETLSAPLREAVESNLLVIDLGTEQLRFRHSLLREALHEDLLPGEHTRWHARLAETLTERPELVVVDQWASEVAHHWYAAHRTEEALVAAHRAADVLELRHAYPEQLRMLERVLALWDVVPAASELVGQTLVDVLLAASRAASRAGDRHRELALDEEAVEAAERTGDVDRLITALVQRGKACRLTPGQDAQPDLRRALELLGDTPSVLRSRALDALAVDLSLNGVGQEALEYAELALRDALALDDVERTISSLCTISTILVDGEAGRVEEGLAAGRKALQLAVETENALMQARVLTNLSHVLCGLGRYDEAAELAREGLQVVASLGLVRSFGQQLAGNVADPLVMNGRWDEALEVIAEYAEGLPGVINGRAYLYYLRAQVSAYRGEPAAAWHWLSEAEALRSTVVFLLQDELPLTRIKASLLLDEHDLDAAWTTLSQPLEVLPSEHGRYLWPMLVVAARIVAARGIHGRDLHDPAELKRCERDASWVSERADTLPVAGDSALAWRAHVDAELARAAGGDRAAQWHEAVQASEKVDEPWNVAYARLRLAEALQREGAVDAAAEAVRSAHEVATRLGARPLAEEAEAWARRHRVQLGEQQETASDVAPIAVAADDPLARFGLTEREREVLELLSEGLSNKQIGQRLFISSKTASVHVSNILAKLGVTSRGEAAALAYRLSSSR